jgi:peptidoglycan LD-endopeptidase LytH
VNPRGVDPGRWREIIERTKPALEKAKVGVSQLTSNTSEAVKRVPWKRVRPGWYLLGSLALYAVFATWQWGSAATQLGETRQKLAVFEKAQALENAKLIWPLNGAGVPQDNDNLPGAPRVYRKGVSQGFVFTGVDSGVSVAYGAPVYAVADGEVIKLDSNFKELTTAEFTKLLENVKDGASENDLMSLRGRQIWIKHSDGTVTRYGHLSKLEPGVGYVTDIKRGDVIGYVGNSGTLEGARGSTRNARLLFEVWLDDETKFFGQGLNPAAVRAEAKKLFRSP